MVSARYWATYMAGLPLTMGPLAFHWPSPASAGETMSGMAAGAGRWAGAACTGAAGTGADGTAGAGTVGTGIASGPGTAFRAPGAAAGGGRLVGVVPTFEGIDHKAGVVSPEPIRPLGFEVLIARGAQSPDSRHGGKTHHHRHDAQHRRQRVAHSAVASPPPALSGLMLGPGHLPTGDRRGRRR